MFTGLHILCLRVGVVILCEDRHSEWPWLESGHVYSCHVPRTFRRQGKCFLRAFVLPQRKAAACTEVCPHLAAGLNEELAGSLEHTSRSEQNTVPEEPLERGCFPCRRNGPGV